MSTLIRPELSRKNPYYIPKERYYELKYHCLQYSSWVRRRNELKKSISAPPSTRLAVRGNDISDPVWKLVSAMEYYDNLIKEVERVCKEAEPDLASYIFKGVTEGLSYGTLLARYEIPCGKDMYYDRYRKFFYILDKSRRMQ